MFRIGFGLVGVSWWLSWHPAGSSERSALTGFKTNAQLRSAYLLKTQCCSSEAHKYLINTSKHCMQKNIYWILKNIMKNPFLLWLNCQLYTVPGNYEENNMSYCNMCRNWGNNNNWEGQYATKHRRPSKDPASSFMLFQALLRCKLGRTCVLE